MFTAYIKNLNDMVFSTSDSPEEQQSTGVLGRIGSWFSPWRGNSPKSPTENASPTSDQPLESDGGDESEESVKLQAGEQRWGEVKDRRSNPTPLHLARDIFLCEEKDATQSGHKRSSVVSSTEAEQGGPKEEEFVVCKKKRIGQDQEWEESSNDTSVSGNPEKNASHLTHLSSFFKQGVAWDSDHAHTQSQAQAGKRLHVYLEETSVTHCGRDTCAGQEVVRTEVTKNLKVLTKSESSPGFELSQSSSSACAENRKTNVKHAAGAQSYYSALAGVSLKSQKTSQSEPEPDKEETESDSMGRKNSSRRRQRKNSQGDGGTSPREKTPTNSQPAPEGFPPVSSPRGESAKTRMGESPVDSTSQHKPASQASPEGVEGKTCCPDPAEPLEDFQDSTSSAADTLACVVDGGAEMEDDDSLYRVQRKTETPESKRRSIKVSRSEVKLFTKYVPFNPKQSPAGSSQDLKLGVKNTNDEERDKPKPETEARLCDLKKEDEKLKPKPAPGRIADKISLFERKQTAEGRKQTFQSPRSADVSPVRKAPEKTKADATLSDQRSRSAEGRSAVRSGSASPVKGKLMSVKDQSENFSAAEAKPAQPQKAAMTGMSQELPPPPVSESTNLDSQGKPDTKEPIATTVSKISLKPDGQDATIADISAPKDPSADSKAPMTMTSKTANQENRCNSAESDVPLKETSDSSEMTNNISPHPKGSRPKRRKSKDSTSPVSLNSELTPTSKMEVSVLKQRQAGDSDKTFSAPIRDTEKVSSGNASDKLVFSDTEEKPLKELEVLDKPEKQIYSPHQNESIDKAIKPGDLPASRDEPDTAAGNDATKSVDKDPVVLPQKEKKAGRHSLVLTQEREEASEDGGKTSGSSPSPAAEGTNEKTLAREQESPAAHPKPNRELSAQPESQSKGRQPGKKGAEQTPQPQNKDTEIKHQSDGKDAGKLKAAENEKANHLEKKGTRQPLRWDADATEGEDSESGRGVSRTQGSVDGSRERKTAETKDKAQAIKEAKQEEPASQTGGSSLPDPRVRTRVIETEKVAVWAVTSANEAARGTACDKGPPKGEAPTNAPPELQTKSTQGPGRERKPVASAAEPPAHSGSLEKTENSLDDSRARGARDEFSGSKPITGAATAVEEVTVKATNDTPAPITTRAGNMGEKQSSIKETTPVPVSKCVNSERAVCEGGEKNSTLKSEPSEVKVSGDAIQLAPIRLRGEKSETPASTSGSSSHKSAEKLGKSWSDRSAAKSSTVNVTEKSAEQRSSRPQNELLPVANGDISLRPQPIKAKEEPLSDKPCQTPKALTSSEANKPTPDSIQHSSTKKLHLPRGQSRDDSSKGQDAPSSWLDVDLPKRKLNVSKPKLSSAGSEGNILDTSGERDDDDFVEKIKKLCAPFSLPPRKHNHLRPPQPPFAMPAIKEDRFEKTFDPEEFTIGLRKKTQFTLDTAPSLLAQLQNSEAKSGLKPARASLADRSMLLSNLDSHSRLREKIPVKVAEEIKEEKDDQIKVKSRLEGSCILSSLTSPSVRGKRNGLHTQVDGTISGDVSPPPLSQPPLPSPAATGPIREQLAKQSSALSDREEAQAAGAAACDSGPPLPCFNDIKLTGYLEKYLPREEVKSAQGTQGQEQAVKEVNGKMSSPVLGGEEDPHAKPGPLIPNAVPPFVPGSPANTQPTVPDLTQPAAQLQGLLGRNVGPVTLFHKRPGKMVLFEKARFSGHAHEIYRDVADATSLRLSPLISVKVVRGCWILYEKPDFQGRSIAVEEGATELANEWAETEVETDPHDAPPMLIGSVRLAVWDYSIPRIDLFTEPEGHGRVTPYHDDAIETGSFGIPLNTASIQVHAGVWLVFSDPGFQGMVAMLEPGQYPVPETWGFPSPFVGSLRPLKMGGFKVENPSEVKAVVYEKPRFEGSCLEIDGDVFSFCEDGGDAAADGALPDSTRPKAVGSLKVTGGLWVGYSLPGFEGQQHVLEEGEYLDCSDWGGSEQLLSLRPILADFVAPHVKLFADRDFAELGGSVDLTGPVINMDDTGYGTKTQSIDVISGIWVVFEEPDFCGKSYILEKGLYGSPEDWGALQPRVASAMPVLLDDFESAAKYKVQLFSDAGFQGSVLSLEDSAATLQDGFTVASCKVLAGSWLAFEGQDLTGRMYVLEVGSYPDLRAMGCYNTSSSIQSLQTVGFEFSLPSITLFERCGLRGKRVVLTDGSVNLQLAGGCGRVQSVLVEGAIWILYERFNYQGAQILLKPGEILDWHKFSGWQKIGSLRPLMQKQVHFRLRNRQTGLMMSVTGSLDDVTLMRIQETEETGGLEQIWFYQNGHLHCKLLEECCLSPSGSVTIAGSRTGLSTEPGIHLWSITPEGFILYTPTSNLVLEVKGGHHYDKTQVILNSLDPNKPQQRWNVEIM